MSDVVTWAAMATAIGAVLSIVTFWTRYSDRLTKADARALAAEKAAEDAKVEAKEAKAEFVKEYANIRADYADLTAKIYKVEIWARDEFVRKGSFELVVARLEKSMELLGVKFEGAVDKMASRIETMNQHHRD